MTRCKKSLSIGRQKRSASAVIALIAMSTIALAGCGVGDDSSAASGSSDSSAPLHEELPKEIQEAGEVVVLSDVPSPPFEMFVSEGSKEITGLDYDLAQALGEQLGVEFNFKVTPFAGIIPALQAGQGDVIISQMSSTEERQEILNFVDYFFVGTGLLVLKGNPEGIAGVEDLCGQAAAAQAGGLQVPFLEAASKECESNGKPAIEILSLPTTPDALLAVSSDKAVAVASDTAAMTYAAKTIDDGKTYELVELPGDPAGYEGAPGGIGVLRENEELTSALQKALQAIIEDGAYMEILKKYGLESIAVDSANVTSRD